MKLVLIHGRAQQEKDPVQLQSEWEEALSQGFSAAHLSRPPGLDICLPFYGDRLTSLIKKIEAPLLVDIITRGAPITSPQSKLQAELMYEMATASGIADSDIHAHVEGPVQKGIENTGWVRAIARALDRAPLGSVTLDRVTHDVSVYLTYSGVRRQIDSIVSKCLSAEACVVVGHSLGSVVGFNVLRDPSVLSKVRRYITLGSPLGLKAIKENLEAPLAMPACTAGWFNARDYRDIVASYPLDGTHFPITPAIENKSDVDNFTENRHGIEGYLNDPIVAKQIYDALISP